MNKNIKFIYFDIGGVFFDWKNVFSKAAKDFGVTVKEIDDVFEENDGEVTKGKIDAQEFWMMCCDKLNIKNGKGYNFLESWISDYEPLLEVHELAKDLKKHYRVGVISNIYKGMYPLLIKRGKIPDVDFNVKILSCDLGMRKPEKEIYELATKESGVKAEEILLIDDSEKSLAGAKVLDWQTFLFNTNNPEKSVSEIKQYLEIL